MRMVFRFARKAQSGVRSLTGYIHSPFADFGY